MFLDEKSNLFLEGYLFDIQENFWHKIQRNICFFSFFYILGTLLFIIVFMTVRTRFAPSPTWYIHIGGLRTLLYCYLWAKKNKWDYILRIEDTDRSRLVDDAIEWILEVHKTLGILPDEWPHKDGGHGPYIQSERTHIYQEKLHKLCQEGSGYYCFCTSERLENLKKEQQELKLPPRYDKHCRHIPYDEAKARVDAGEKYTIRLKVPEAETLIFNDLIRWKIEFKTSEIDDQILLKSDGFPTYHGAIVIDDDMMEITHVMRWEEWISSMPKQILTARALGIDLPEYAHLPNILGNDWKKLSKRTGDVSVAQYLEKWYLKEALLNFLALLGWHPKEDTEIMSMDEMIARFEIKHIQKSGALFDTVKLDWMNGEYIRAMEIDDLYDRLVEFLQTYEPDFYETVFSQKEESYNKKILTELQTRMKRFNEYIELTPFFYKDAKIRNDLLVNEKMKIMSEKEAKTSLQMLLPYLKDADFENEENFKNLILGTIKAADKKNGQVLWPMRVALSGEKFSPWAFELALILWKDETIRRIENLIQSS